MLRCFLIVIHIFAVHAVCFGQRIAFNDFAFETDVRRLLVENKVPAAGVAIIENGKTKYLKVFGELKKGTLASDNTIFNVASITKPVITMLVLKFVQDGQWQLDEPLYHYWIDPDVKNDPQHRLLTTRHVLTHQTGFDNWRFQRPDKKLVFNYKPGTNSQYSGEGFVYLSRALEQKFKKSLSTLADSLLFTPLNMKDSRLYWDHSVDESRFAFWHDSEGRIYEVPTPKSRQANAAGSLLTTLADFCKFGIDVLEGSKLSQEIFEEMVRPYVFINNSYSRGLGWEVIAGLPGGEYALEHGGSDNGVKTIAILLPKSKRGVVVLTNGDNGMLVYPEIIKKCIDIGGNIFEKMSGVSKPPIVTLEQQILESYTGVFRDSYGRNLAVENKDSTLLVSGPGVPSVTLFPVSKSKFIINDFDIQFEFETQDSIVITANGKIDCTAQRIK